MQQAHLGYWSLWSELSRRHHFKATLSKICCQKAIVISIRPWRLNPKNCSHPVWSLKIVKWLLIIENTVNSFITNIRENLNYLFFTTAIPVIRVLLSVQEMCSFCCCFCTNISYVGQSQWKAIWLVCSWNNVGIFIAIYISLICFRCFQLFLILKSRFQLTINYSAYLCCGEKHKDTLQIYPYYLLYHEEHKFPSFAHCPALKPCCSTILQDHYSLQMIFSILIIIKNFHM